VTVSCAYKFLGNLLSPAYGVYYTAEYSVFGILLVATFLKIRKKRATTSYHTILTSSVAIVIIEAINYNIRGPSIYELDLLRHILYNPLIMPVINVFLFGIYLSFASDSSGIDQARIGIKIIYYFSLFCIIFWLAVYFDIIFVDELNKNNYLNNNQLCYASLFSAYCAYRYKKILHFDKSLCRFIFLTSFITILINTCRGAQLCALLLVLFQIFFQGSIKMSFLYILKTFCMLTVFFLIIATAIFSFQSNPSKYEGVFFDQDLARSIMKSCNSLVLDLNIIPDIETERVSDLYSDRDVSSTSRFFTNYIGLLYFTKYPVVGIGTELAYSIKVLGEGIHSFLFLYIASLGTLGIVALSLSFVSLFQLFGLSKSFIFGGLCAVLIFAIPALLFMNHLATYIVYLFFLESKAIIFSRGSGIQARLK
jgi:hypothetical protein